MKNPFSEVIVRLTTVYVAVLTVVCVLFSLLIYQQASREIDDTSRRQVVGFRNMLGRFVVTEIESEELRFEEAEQSRDRLKVRLVSVNIVVIGTGAVLSYWFARRTLRPIEDNVRVQERFTSDASHELRTPLSIIRSEIEVALRDKSLEISGAKDLMKSNLEEVNRMQQLVENLLQLARTQTLELNDRVNLNELIDEVISRYHQQAKQAGVGLSSNIDSKLNFKTNRAALAQTLNILVDNGTKYAGKGSTIEITARRNHRFVDICVNDDGVGIDEVSQSTLFDRFTRVDKSRTSQNTSGQGLGLSIAMRICQSLGGDISVNSRPNKGAKFKIRLPIRMGRQ